MGRRAGVVCAFPPEADSDRRDGSDPLTDMGENRDQVVKVRITATELQWLRDIAALEDWTVSAVLRLALKEFYKARAAS